MNFTDFVQYVKTRCMYETIYEDSDSNLILVIRMLDAYGMANKMSEKRWPSAAIGKETLQDALKRENTTPPQQEQEPVATDWERIARVQDAKLRAMCDEAGGFEKLCEVMDKYERTTPPQRKPLSDEEKQAMWSRTKVYLTPKRSYFQGIADSEAAHGIKENI